MADFMSCHNTVQGAKSLKTSMRLQVVIGLILALAVGSSLIFFVAIPLARITQWKVAGTSIPIGELKLLAGAGTQETFFTVDCPAMERSLATHPRIESARVSLLFPNCLNFAITERKVVVIALVEFSGAVMPVAVDRHGVAFMDARELDSVDMPVLSGIKFENFKFGLSLPNGLIPMIESIAVLASEQPSLMGLVSEIKPVRRAYGEFDFLVYPMNFRMPVRTGSALSGPLLESMALVLDLIGSGNMSESITELDFRSGTVVYRTKGGTSG